MESFGAVFLTVISIWDFNKSGHLDLLTAHVDRHVEACEHKYWHSRINTEENRSRRLRCFV